MDVHTVDMHGLQICGLKDASDETDDYTRQSFLYNDVWYNTNTGAVWVSFEFSMSRMKWVYTPKNGIIQVCRTAKHMTEQQLADAVRDAVNEYNVKGPVAVYREILRSD